jgi:hypothetical protein
VRVAALTVAEERNLELRGRVSSWREAKLISAEEAARLLTGITAPQRVSRMAGRITSFVLASFLILAAFWFFHALSLPKGWITAIVAVGIAEYLIRRKRFLRTGIEEGLYLAGLFSFIFGLPGEGAPEAMLLFLAAALFAAMRLRQPIFYCIALFCAFAYVIWKGDKLGLDELQIGYVVAALALLCSIVALTLLRRWRESPAIERALAIIVAVAPAGAYAALLMGYGSARTPWIFAVLLGAYGVVLIWVGLRLALHAPIVGGALLLVLIGFDVAEALPIVAEAKFIGAGLVLLVGALLVERRLRARSSGVTSDSLMKLREQELFDLASAAVLAPATRTAAGTEGGPQLDDSPDSGSSSFGGGGSTGSY